MRLSAIKSTTAILSLLTWAFFANANEIDKLNTIKDIEQFMVEKIDSNFIRYADPADSIVGFLKIDIDGNGATDLIVNSLHSFAVLDTGKGNYQRHYIGGYYTGVYVIDVVHAKNDLLIPIKRQNECYNSVGYRYDTLTFKFGGFIEYNSHPDSLKIEKIRLKTYDGYPGMNIELNIDSTGWATCEQGYVPRIFAGAIDSAQFDKLRQIINYIKLSSLACNYPITGMDCFPSDQEVYGLEVTFNNGQVKRIRDYAGSGTFGLSTLYRELVSLYSEKKLEELR